MLSTQLANILRKWYQQDRFFQLRLFTDFAVTHLKFFPYPIWLQKIRPDLRFMHMQDQVSKDLASAVVAFVLFNKSECFSFF